MAASNFPVYVAHNYPGSLVDDYAPSADAIIPGSLVYFDTGTNTIKLCGADPTLIAGIAEGGLNTGGSPSGVLPIIDGGKMPVRKLTGAVIVALSSPTTLSESNVTVAYGIAKASNGNWQLDTTDTSNTRVTVDKVDTVTNTAFCRFLAANLQFDGVVS